MRIKGMLRLTLVAIFLTTYMQTFAQGDVDVFLEILKEDAQKGAKDANTLIEGYMTPMMEGLGIGLNNGWFGTAASHKSFGMDIGFVAGMAFVPEDKLTFRPTNMELFNDAQSDLPTIFGSSNQPDPLTLKSNGAPFGMAPGIGMKDEIGFNAVPYVIPQIGIGIYKGTDIKFRFLPEISLGDNSSIKVIGFGVLHDIKQHIPGIKLLPFDLSVMVGYTKINMNSDLSDRSFSFTDPTRDPVTSKNGYGDITYNCLVYQALISKKFSVITFYGALGYRSPKSNLSLIGDFHLNDGFRPHGIPITDPIDADLYMLTPKFNASLRLKLATLSLNFYYNAQS